MGLANEIHQSHQNGAFSHLSNSCDLLNLSSQLLACLSINKASNYSSNSEHYTLVPCSIYNGDTFRVSDGNEEIKVRLCGIDSPEKDQALGIESRDHLRRLISQGDGHVILVRTDADQYGRTIAKAFIPTGNGDKENSSE